MEREGQRVKRGRYDEKKGNKEERDRNAGWLECTD